VPALPEHDRVEVPEVSELSRVTLAWLKVQVRPADGDAATASDTVPAKPCCAGRLWTVIVEFPSVPARMVTVVGLAFTVKS
jgi:hypothetical protein